jgi:hypothetical protein
MSIPTEERANQFLDSLRQNLVILLLHDTRAKFMLSRFILECARVLSLDTTILDTDAFYSSNADKLIDDGDLRPALQAETLLLTQGDFKVASLLPLLASKRQLIVIDDLNSLYSLATDGQKTNQLRIIMRILSYNARMNDSWVIAAAYRTDIWAGTKGHDTGRRSLMALGDLLVETYFSDGSLKLKSEFASSWPNSEFAL